MVLGGFPAHNWPRKAVDPLGLLRSIRDALRPGGSYLCLAINCSDQAAANVGPIATLLYGFWVLYCMTTSLAEGGEGLGHPGTARAGPARAGGQGRLRPGTAGGDGQPVQQPLRAHTVATGSGVTGLSMNASLPSPVTVGRVLT
jgi:hypothetical protein